MIEDTRPAHAAFAQKARTYGFMQVGADAKKGTSTYRESRRVPPYAEVAIARGTGDTIQRVELQLQVTAKQALAILRFISQLESEKPNPAVREETSQ